MKKPEIPCQYCEDRTAECHATCERYAAYAVQQEEYRNERANRKRQNMRPIWSHSEYKKRVIDNKQAKIRSY